MKNCASGWFASEPSQTKPSIPVCVYLRVDEANDRGQEISERADSLIRAFIALHAVRKKRKRTAVESQWVALVSAASWQTTTKASMS